MGVEGRQHYPGDNPIGPARRSRVSSFLDKPATPVAVPACITDEFVYADGAFNPVAVPPWFAFFSLGGVNILTEEVQMAGAGQSVFLLAVGAPCTAAGIGFGTEGEVSMIFRGFTDTGVPAGARPRAGVCMRNRQPIITKFAYAAWYQANPDSTGVVAIVRWTDGGNTTLVSAGLALTVGDKFALRCEGSSPTALELKVNGAIILSTTDALAELQVDVPGAIGAGLGHFDNISGGGVNGSTTLWDTWELAPLS